MASSYIKKSSISLIMREIKRKATMSYHLTPVRMVKINKSGKDRCWQGCGERGTLLHSWWECKLVRPLWKTVWRILKKLKIELPYNPANCTTWYLPQRYKCSDLMGHLHTDVYSSNVHNSQTMERTQMSINR